MSSLLSMVCCCFCKLLQRKFNQWVRADRAKRAKLIMKKYNTELTKAALRKGAGMAAALASSLYNHNFIHDRYFKELIKKGNKIEPEVELVYVSSIISAVRRLVYMDPDVFPYVTQALKEHESIKQVALKMEKEYYNDEDVMIKVFVVGSTVVSGFIVIAIILAFLIWYYVTTPISGCLKLSTNVSHDILHSSYPSVLNIDELNITCRDLLDEFPSGFMTSCSINRIRDAANGSINSNDIVIGTVSNKNPATCSVISINDIIFKNSKTDSINSNEDQGIDSNEQSTDSINTKDDIVPRTSSIYNSTCVVEAIIRIESNRSTCCVQNIAPVLDCLGVKLNITGLMERTSSNNGSNNSYILDKSNL